MTWGIFTKIMVSFLHRKVKVFALLFCREKGKKKSGEPDYKSV